ncbi:MAG: hypothetical protein HF978_04815 [Desulfobacteraceae bacterium]|nr:hypothetical protein [Desulfobacteraceae bacterium]MBC2754851.1 hypothetical protein [Desulfobacteraceae bacterium]
MKKNIVVIGAGLAGTLICNELVKECHVTLLEVGGKNVIGYPKINFIQKRFANVKTFCVGGGGTTNLWHNGLIPILPQDVISNDFKEVLAEAESFHDKAAANLFWLDNPYSTEYEKVISETNLLAEKIGVFSDGVDCLLYPKKFSKLDVATAVNAHYSVSDIVFSSVDKKITSVSYYIGKKRYSVDADVVIISAGALGSPLLVKKVMSAINCSAVNVGTGLADHPLGFIGKVKVKKSFNRVMKQFSARDQGNYECRTAIRVKSQCGKYTGCAFLRPALTMENNLPIYKFKSLLGASSGADRIKNMFSWKLFHPDILAEIYSHLFRINIPGRIYNILFLFEQKRGKSYVTYDGSGLKVDWRITEDELKIYKRMIQKLNNMLAGIADEVNPKTDITEDWLWSAAHHSGTISLGKKEDDLVDKDLKLNACDNVFVCDGSVIQEHSYANTGLTIGSLAMRLAERVCR